MLSADTVKDHTGKKSWTVDNGQYLTPLQEKMMSSQPDLILKYAHYVADQFRAKDVIFYKDGIAPATRSYGVLRFYKKALL